jgi:hypothetical protein
MKKVILALLLTIPGFLPAQDLTIEECYTLASKNYPLVKQRELIAKSAEYSISNLSKGFWPQITIIGQGTTQSEVTQVPIDVPGVEVKYPSLARISTSSMVKLTRHSMTVDPFANRDACRNIMP